MLGRLVLAAAAGLFVVAAPNPADASHPFQGSGQLNINYLYRNLEVPTGTGIITYSLCGTTEHPSVPTQWRTGIENWDNAIGRWQFNEVSCGSSSNTKVIWESGGDVCDPIAWACWYWGGSTPGHGSHLDLVYNPLDPTRIKIDYNNFYGRPNDQWRVYIAAHEWGHNMSLADHSGTSDCGQNTLMLNYVGASIPPNPCNTSPTTNDLNSVACNVYKLCAGVRVASGDVDGDGCDEIITSAGPGPMPYVRVWDALVGNCITSTSGIFVRAQFPAYVDGFEGGVYVAAGNIDPSTAADEVITGAGPGGGPHVKVWRINANGTATELTGFMAYDGFTGGVRVGAGDLDCDGADEVLTAPGPVRTPTILAWNFDLSRVHQLGFPAYPTHDKGVFVAGGDMNSGWCGGEILTGPDAGGGAHVRAWCCASGGEMVGWFAYDPAFGGGARVAVGNAYTPTSNHEMITAAGPGGGPHVRVWRCCTYPPFEVLGFYAYDQSISAGVFVASGNVDPSTASWEIVTGVDAFYGGTPHVRVWRCCTFPPAEVRNWNAY